MWVFVFCDTVFVIKCMWVLCGSNIDKVCMCVLCVTDSGDDGDAVPSAAGDGGLHDAAGVALRLPGHHGALRDRCRTTDPLEEVSYHTQHHFHLVCVCWG